MAAMGLRAICGLIFLASVIPAHACGWTRDCISRFVHHVHCPSGREMLASWYGPASGHTASGRSYGGMCAAHRSMPFGTVLTVHNPRNGRTCRITITDRGPWGAAARLGAQLDLQNAAADCLGGRNTRYVCVE